MLLAGGKLRTCDSQERLGQAGVCRIKMSASTLKSIPSMVLSPKPTSLPKQNKCAKAPACPSSRLLGLLRQPCDSGKAIWIHMVLGASELFSSCLWVSPRAQENPDSQPHGFGQGTFTKATATNFCTTSIHNSLHVASAKAAMRSPTSTMLRVHGPLSPSAQQEFDPLFASMPLRPSCILEERFFGT